MTVGVLWEPASALVSFHLLRPNKFVAHAAVPAVPRRAAHVVHELRRVVGIVRHVEFRADIVRQPVDAAKLRRDTPVCLAGWLLRPLSSVMLGPLGRLFSLNFKRSALGR